MATTHRYNVEVKRDEFEEVGAHEMSVGPGGTLLFWTDGRLDVAFAAGSWLTAGHDYAEEV